MDGRTGCRGRFRDNGNMSYGFAVGAHRLDGLWCNDLQLVESADSSLALED